ncbi:hypothetical protein CRE_16466 [Caenorhabditis remanei]|uniref:Uncharacterized protein n=1 Tax=Caenorhabditis remanei TaxID=31234 RepID=E3NHD5_CAERE|nr:hypothetical protein CRE_16466 [Caenorhabditis remanei]
MENFVAVNEGHAPEFEWDNCGEKRAIKLYRNLNITAISGVQERGHNQKSSAVSAPDSNLLNLTPDFMRFLCINLCINYVLMY